MDHGVARSSASSSQVPGLLPQATTAINLDQAQARKAASDASSIEESTIDSQDERFTDSGYASRNLSCRSSKLSNLNEGPPVFVLESKLFRRKARKLQLYNKEISRSTWDRFNALNELHGQPLLDSLSTQRVIDSLTKRRRKFGPLSISWKLKVLGETEATAKPWVVVFCDEADYRGVRNFYDQKHVIADYQGPHTDADLPSLEVIIHPRSPQLLAANDYPGIYASWANDDNLGTLCGQLIRACDTNIATLGGIIRIGTSEDEFMLYGLTAGHVFQRDAFGSDHDSELDNEGEDEGIELFCIEERFELDLEAFSDHDSEIIAESSNPLQHIELGNACSRVGHVVVTSSETSDSKGDLDWALVEIEDLSLFRPNLVTERDFGQQHLTKRGLSELCSSPLPETNRVVLVLSGLGGIREGLLSTYPSFIKLPSGDDFIKTYNLSLSHGFKLRRGDCGSWVVDSLTYQVYGHIVASDSINEAYVVPLQAIFRQIKNYAGTNHVRLAGENDIQKWRSRHANGKSLVRKGAQRSHGVSAFGFVNKGPCITTSSNIREPTRSTKISIGGKRGGVIFPESSPAEPSNQPYIDQSISNWALSLNQVPSPLLTSLGSNAQQPKLYTPPLLARFSTDETQEPLLKLDKQEITRVASEWATARSPSDSDSSSSLSWRRLHPETEKKIKRAFTLREQHEQSKEPPISSMEELSNLVSDELHAASPEYLMQYRTIAPWTELPPEPLALKKIGWDSGYSTADSANHSPAP